jgi:hypothetical protein
MICFKHKQKIGSYKYSIFEYCYENIPVKARG